MKRILFILCIFFAGLCSAQQTCTRSLSGVNYQSGTSYSFVALDTTRITSFNNASAVAATLAAGVTNPNFGACSVFSVINLGQGTLTITCSSCTINGSATLALTYLQGADIYGDGDNYVALGVGGGGSSGSGCATNPFDGGCMLAGNPSIDFFPGSSSGGAGTGWFVQFLNNQANFKLPINITVGSGNAGVITWICGTVSSLGSGISIVAPASCTPYILILPSAPGSGYMQLSNVGSTITAQIEAAINLGNGTDTAGINPVIQGGTGASSASAALINLFPSPIKTGDWLYWNGTTWTNFGGCGSSTCILSENGAGAPGYIQTPMPVIDGGSGLATQTPNAIYKGNGTSAPVVSTATDTGAGAGVFELTNGRLMFAGSAPTCTFASGGGTTPSCTVDTGSTDSNGIIIATTGSGSPAGTGTITLTFSQTFGTNKPVCEYQMSDNGGTWAAYPVAKDETPSTSGDLFEWKNFNGTTATSLSTATAYWINYHCHAK